MAAVASAFNAGRLALFNRTFQVSSSLASVVWKITLHNASYVPNASTQAVYSDLTNELATANGYTNGGNTLSSVTLTQPSATVIFTAGNTSWTASGGSIVASFAVIRAFGSGGTDPLLLWYLLDNTGGGQPVTTTNTNTLTIAFNASGIWTMAGG